MTVLIERPLILEAYRKAESRILFLDYDGTLVPFKDRPEDSDLDTETHEILSVLSLDPRNRIYIISGRDKGFLTSQFRGVSVGLVAEHGFLLKETDGDWIRNRILDNTWKNDIGKQFEALTIQFPGSFTEEKEASVAFHYRTAGKNTGSRIRRAIRKKFQLFSEQYPGLVLLDGDNILEIKPCSYNKGTVASSIVNKGTFDFILAAGDDLTDEDLFKELVKGTFTIKIGTSPTSARFYIPVQEEFVGLLKGFLS
jgi:trehalose 6-phosphate synthase/phosphatase